ncbi:MAG TPA: hypothetical protein VNN21_06455 [Dehalococcoidia bacterium]|jgi:hypothetical protein|nr:hypothetical protein [Dehalococcoidia bacterium]
MPMLVSLAEARDVVVIVYGIIGILFFLIALIVLVVVGFAAKGLIQTARGLLDESVKPAIDSVKDAAETVRGSTEFVARTAVAPVVRVYGAAAGVRKGLSVLAGLTGRSKAK